MAVETEKQMQRRNRREAVSHYFYECGYTYFRIAKLLSCTMSAVQRDVIYLKAKQEETGEGSARLSVSLKSANGKIRSVVDRTLIDTIRRIEEKDNYDEYQRRKAERQQAA